MIKLQEQMVYLSSVKSMMMLPLVCLLQLLCNGNNVLRIEKGDALLFYNYDWIENLDGDEDVPQTGPIINWRSIHSGMRTTEEKWIATNWFYFHE
mmetsp:Transcript_6121/g.11602  ORF Transcript_6121/g.11602 Transcript_6121/m.11602 type:complete len:95 (+) Transcript_6121:1040-1324(+)